MTWYIRHNGVINRMAASIIHTDKILKGIVSSIVRIAHPDKIILFGSRATGKAKKDSDYDVLVLKKNSNRKALMNKLYSTGLNADAPVDIVVNTPKRFEELKSAFYYIYGDIAKFGIVVYEKK